MLINNPKPGYKRIEKFGMVYHIEKDMSTSKFILFDIESRAWNNDVAESILENWIKTNRINMISVEEYLSL